MKENPKEEILKLKDGECWIWPESDYGRAEIWRINEMMFVFNIPMYGGVPYYHDAYRVVDVDNLIKEIESWT